MSATVLAIIEMLVVPPIEDNGHANWTGNKNSVEKTADAVLMIDDGNGGCRDFWTS